MMKRKLATVYVALLLLPLAFGLIQPVTATNSCWFYWHDYIDYYESPVNVSTSRVVSGADGHCTDTVELVVTIAEYHYDTFVDMDFVYFKVAVYVKSVADPGYQPQYATQVSIHFKKIYDDPEHTMITMEDKVLPPGYSQGEGLVQSYVIDSSYEQRSTLSLKALAFAVGLACEPVGVAVGLIELAQAFRSTAGDDFQDAGYGDTFAYSWWDNQLHWPEGPVRQYCFNCFHWFQDHNVPPYSSYGLKIWASVNTLNQAVIPPIITSPIYLVITYGGGGGTCPYVSTWNGNQYVLDNNVLPASETSNGADVKDYYRLEQLLVPTYEGKLFSYYSLQISEFEHEHSYFDEVKLLAADHPPDVNVAVTPYGEILTYSNPVPPISAVDDDGVDVLSLLSSVDENHYQSYNGSYVTLIFAPTDLSNGTKLVIRADRPPNPKSPVYIQVLNATGNWNTVAVFHTRTYWATDIINMTGCLPDAEGNLKVRLYFVSNDKIDYIGLDTTPQANMQVRQAFLLLAFHSTQGNVRWRLLENDNIYAELVPEERIHLTFLLPNNQNQERTFILYTEGHYEAIG